MMSVTCPYCSAGALLVTGDVIYPHRPELQDQRFWQCAPCGAYVGCHKKESGHGDGTFPLGVLANAELRAARKAAHAALDPVWRSGALSRKAAYQWLARELAIAVEDCHIGLFNVARCIAATSAVQQLEGRSPLDVASATSTGKMSAMAAAFMKAAQTKP